MLRKIGIIVSIVSMLGVGNPIAFTNDEIDTSVFKNIVKEKQVVIEDGLTPKTVTIESLDIPWEPGDAIEVYAEGPLEYAFTDQNGNEVYHNSAGEQVFADRSTAADSTPYVAPQHQPKPSTC